jgi:hypothetical protein
LMVGNMAVDILATLMREREKFFPKFFAWNFFSIALVFFNGMRRLSWLLTVDLNGWYLK